MARRGRELERLVQQLETALARTPVEVLSPCFVEGRASGSRREIDVGVRGSFGSMDLFVMIECRHRKAAGDVQWIEQIKSKLDDVGADHAVAVSSSGFTEGARLLADRHGIGLRTFDELDDGTELSWLGLGAIELDTYDVEVAAVEIDLTADGHLVSDDSGGSIPLDSDGLKLGDQRLVDRATGRVLSVDDLVKEIDLTPFRDKLTTDGGRERCGQFILQVAPGRLALRGAPEPADVAEIRIAARVRIQTTHIPLRAFFQYSAVGGQLQVEGSAAEATISGVPLVFTLTKELNDDGTVTFRAGVQTSDGQPLPKFTGGVEWEVLDTEN